MGWSSGSGIFDDIINALLEAEVDDEQRQIIYTKLIETFTYFDCDTLFECMGKDEVFDKVLKETDEDLYEED